MIEQEDRQFVFICSSCGHPQLILPKVKYLKAKCEVCHEIGTFRPIVREVVTK